MQSGYLKIKNWKKFQHYNDRNPPWIKLHFEILSSTDWVTLNDASRVLAVASMLIASRNDGKVPADPHYIKRVAYLNTLPNFKPLINCGFFENPQADASTLQADARPETETETYSKEIEESINYTKSKKLIFMPFEILPTEWKNWAVEEKGFDDLALQDIFSLFREYWVFGKGKKTKREDWLATWRNWIRNQKSTGGNYNVQANSNQSRNSGSIKTAKDHANDEAIRRVALKHGLLE